MFQENTDRTIFIPKVSYLAEQLVEKAHILTIHGQVPLTMAKVRVRDPKFTTASEENN